MNDIVCCLPLFLAFLTLFLVDPSRNASSQGVRGRIQVELYRVSRPPYKVWASVLLLYWLQLFDRAEKYSLKIKVRLCHKPVIPIPVLIPITTVTSHLQSTPFRLASVLRWHRSRTHRKTGRALEIDSFLRQSQAGLNLED